MSKALHKKFEATYRACFPIAAELQPNLFSFELDDDEYVEAKVHIAFTLWQAARATAEQSRDSAIEACAQEADKLSVKYWDDYKRGKGPERANPYFEGKSDGAEEAADAIRALKSQQDAAIESKPAEQPDGPSEQNCGCETCRPITMTDMRMIVCKTCGNKRCPHATDHRNACTGSNELGQPGSSYAAIESQRSGDGS